MYDYSRISNPLSNIATFCSFDTRLPYYGDNASEIKGFLENGKIIMY